MCYYRKCPLCGANLDPGEACDCSQERNTITGEPEKKSNAGVREWRRFELLTQNSTETKELEKILDEKHLSRKDLAVILFGIRVKPGIQRSDFKI